MEVTAGGSTTTQRKERDEGAGGKECYQLYYVIQPQRIFSLKKGDVVGRPR